MRKKRPIEERFWEKVKISSGCWRWLGAPTKNGYGVIYSHDSGKQEFAHRASYAINIGDIPDGFCVCHKCDNPLCVRPDHLFIGTQAENLQDCRDKGRSKYFDTSKLSENDVVSMRIFYAFGQCTQRDLADAYGVKYQAAHRAIRGKTWKNISTKQQ